MKPAQGIFGGSFDTCPGEATLLAAVGAGAGDVTKRQLRVQLGQKPGEVEREVVGDVFILLLTDADRGDAQAKKAGVVADQLWLDRGQVEKIGMNQLAQLRMRSAERLAINDKNLLDIRMVQALQKNAFPDHACCSGDDDFHCGGLNAGESRYQGGRIGGLTQLTAERGQPVVPLAASRRFRWGSNSPTARCGPFK
jgi:hypothetical protein